MTEKTKNKLTSLTKEKYQNFLVDGYNNLKEAATSYNIVLKDIEYSDFIYTVDNDGGVDLINGILYFKYNNEIYQIKSTSIDTSNHFILMDIEYLRKRR